VQGSCRTQAIGATLVMAYSGHDAALLIVIRKLRWACVWMSQSEQTGLDIAQHRERMGT
jgi:Amt family ammonium transporter